MAVVRPKETAEFSIKIGDLPKEKLRIVSFYGNEALSELFRFTVELASSDGEIDFANAIGQPALLTIQMPKGKRYINGVVSQFEQSGRNGKWTLYQAEIVPVFWTLSQRYNCRIFQGKTIKEIIEQVVDDGKIPSDQLDFSLKEDSLRREYCVQYRESDLAFITRLMEQYGYYYFFKHEANNHVMVVGDDPVIHAPIENPKLLFQSGASDDESEYISHFRYTQETRPGIFTHSDYDFKKPGLNLEASEKVKGDGEYEVYDYPGEYPYDDGGNRSLSFGKSLAKVRLQEAQAGGKAGTGQTNCRRLIPGYRFTLDNHDRTQFNVEYLLTRVSHSGSEPQALEAHTSNGGGPKYHCDFECIPSDIPFRPARITPKPVIQGPQTATVVGPSGEEIYTNEFGQVKVQFRWDREGKKDEKSSCWIRVSQLWAGAGWGAMFIPRIDDEVIVQFEEGDPDQPIITGRVYNGSNKPPYELPAEKTKSTIKSNTSKGGGGYNELLLDDTKDKTQVVLYNAYGHKMTQDEETQSIMIETRDKNFMRFDDKEKNIKIETTNAHSILMDDENKKMVLKTTDEYSIEMDDENELITIQTKNGHILKLDDQNKKIEVTTVDGHTMILDDDNQKIGLITTEGHNLTIDDSGQVIALQDADGANMLTIDIGGSKVMIASSGDIELEAGGKISLKAMDVEIAADNELMLTGGSKGTLDGGIECSVKGVTTKMEGSAMTEVKGALVKIN